MKRKYIREKKNTEIIAVNFLTNKVIKIKTMTIQKIMLNRWDILQWEDETWWEKKYAEKSFYFCFSFLLVKANYIIYNQYSIIIIIIPI